MPKRTEVCPHCRGRKVCQISGGRSCRDCLSAAGMGRRSWGAVRCSVCGGSGRIVVEEESPPPEEQQKAEQGEQ